MFASGVKTVKGILGRLKLFLESGRIKLLMTGFSYHMLKLSASNSFGTEL